MKILKKNIKFLTNSEALKYISKSNPNMENIAKYCKYNDDVDLYDALKEKGLSEFEIIQIINIRPDSIIDLALIIEEMEERYDEDGLNEILNLLNN